MHIQTAVGEKQEPLWHAMSAEEVYRALQTSAGGLAGREAKKRLAHWGPNRLPRRVRASWLPIFLRQAASPLVAILLIAAGVVVAVELWGNGHADFTDAYIILGAVALTVCFGFFQEFKAERTFESLQKIVRKRARVLRGGEQQEMDAELLVPGDVIYLGEGELIPADARLVQVHDLEIDEAPLTGESLPIAKYTEVLERGVILPERTNMAYMGTTIARGRGIALVCATGADTELGRIAKSVAEIKQEATPLQRHIGHLARMLSFAFAGVVVSIFFIGIARGFPLIELFIVSVAVAVAAIPESLVVALTVILAIGMMRLLRARALVRRLASAETLGSTTVICTDKTGTLTEGRMQVVEVMSASENPAARELALFIGMLTNEAYIENPTGHLRELRLKGDPTEQALLRAGIDAGLLDVYMQAEHCILDELPFESRNQYMATLFSQQLHALLPAGLVLPPQEQGDMLMLKGASEKILSNCTRVLLYDKEKNEHAIVSLLPERKKELEHTFEELSTKGLRVLGTAFRPLASAVRLDGNANPLIHIVQLGNALEDGVFTGFIALADPLRAQAKAMVHEAQQAGVRVIMITGDHKLTAHTIGAELGLDHTQGAIMEGKEIAQLSDEELVEAAAHARVYARILPEDKLRIVRALQARGEVVAMTGDGINDAPALRQANIGIAMGSGQDVAKETADIVLLDNNFATIVRAVREGRIIKDNIRKVITYLLGGGFTEMILVGASVVFGLPLPVLAPQILWVNLIDDSFPAFTLAAEPAEKDVMRRKPEGSRGLLTPEMFVIIFAIGILTDLLVFGAFVWFYTNGYDLAYVRTISFANLGISTIFLVLALRSLRQSIFSMHVFSNPAIWGSIAVAAMALFGAVHIPFLQMILHTVPLQWEHWMLVLAIGLSNLVLIELAKWVFRSDVLRNALRKKTA